ncbi:XRE family transcriptional regulator [Providencia sp. PROV206]|uniref:XRE family transcriptional regulator n=1 Tax=Providencia sp. PROV206 TaxID=2949904 RepID=UPI002349405F|nr:XRE family transcriptional regulator [Providencia sp. PROV206]
MNRKKTLEVSFQDKTKESLLTTRSAFKERLKILIGNRSIRTAAKDWGLSFSTLNNYLTKDTDPALSTIQSIATQENVSLDWLVNGLDQGGETLSTNTDNDSKRELSSVWNMLFNIMTTEQVNQLIRIITTKGIDGILESKSNACGYNLDQALNDLKIRPTLQQVIRLALAGDESIDREILHRIEEKKNTNVSGGLNQDANHSKAG